MTPTDLRTALTSVADAAPVPAVDRLGVERRVRVARRRRTAARGLVAAAVVAALAVGALAWPRGETPTVATAPPAGPVVPVLVDGELTLVHADGSADRTGVRLERLLGMGENGVVGISPERDLLVAQVTDDGIGLVRDLSGGPVGSAALSVDGSGLVWVDDEQQLHVRGTVSGSWTYDEALSGWPGQVLATDGRRWLVVRAGRAYVEGGKHTPLPLDGPTGAVSAVLTGRVAAVTDATGTTRLYDARTGAASEMGPILSRGALAPDGSFRVLEPHELAAWWATGTRGYAVVADGAGRVLEVCTQHDCRPLWTDPTGTLRLPGQS